MMNTQTLTQSRKLTVWGLSLSYCLTLLCGLKSSYFGKITHSAYVKSGMKAPFTSFTYCISRNTRQRFLYNKGRTIILNTHTSGGPFQLPRTPLEIWGLSSLANQRARVSNTDNSRSAASQPEAVSYFIFSTYCMPQGPLHLPSKANEKRLFLCAWVCVCVHAHAHTPLQVCAHSHMQRASQSTRNQFGGDWQCIRACLKTEMTIFPHPFRMVVALCPRNRLPFWCATAAIRALSWGASSTKDVLLVLRTPGHDKT